MKDTQDNQTYIKIGKDEIPALERPVTKCLGLTL